MKSILRRDIYNKRKGQTIPKAQVQAWDKGIGYNQGHYRTSSASKIEQKMDYNHVKGLRVSFEEFISWIASGRSGADEHWTPISTLCSVCSMNFNFIGQLESFDEDLELLVSRLKVPKAGNSKIAPKFCH